MDSATAARVEIRIRQQLGGGEVYIPAAPKRVAQLKLCALATPPSAPQEIQRSLGISRRHSYTLMAMFGTRTPQP